MTKSYKKISDYSLIGDLVTCALIGKDGSIDWYCLPHINSPSVFAGILDINNGGHFFIQPSGKYSTKQQYLDHTNIVLTKFKTLTGQVTITDFMPIKHVERPYENTFPTLIRKIQCTRGKIPMNIEFYPKFDYARSKIQLRKTQNGIVAKNSKENLYLNTSIPIQIHNDRAIAKYTIKQGETIWFALQYNDDRTLTEDHYKNALKTTTAFWKSWVNNSDVWQNKTGLFKNPWKNLIIRSGLVLKLLIQDMTGSICAAATTSLPEKIGGSRNWDYRFNWIRDASFTVRALYKLGYIKESRKHLEWFMQMCSENTEAKDLQIMFGLNGETDLKEEELSHLSGYKNSKPVRIGNKAAKQKQLDIYGELVDVFYETSRFGIDISKKEWEFICKLVDYVCEIWDTKDAGIWEVRGEYQHFVHSKLMCWVAIDRAIKIAKKQNKEAPYKKWEESRDHLKKDIIEKGFNKKLNTFVQAYGSEIVDATCLLIPIMKLLPYEDPKVQGTLKAVLKKLTTKNGLVYRYEQDTDDGIKCGEGAFLLCSFWLIDVLAYSGRIDEAKSILLKIGDYASTTGLLPEEIDPNNGEALGNYPQAYSHIGLINSILFIEKAERKGIKKNNSIEMTTLTRKFKNLVNEKRIKQKAKNF